MINNWKQFNEELEVNVTESSYITFLDNKRVDIGWDSNKNDIDYAKSKKCNIYWSIDIIDDKDEIVSIKPIINKIELTLIVTYYKQPYNEDEIDNTEDREETYTFTKADIDDSYKEEIKFPFRPRSVDFDLRTKSKIKVDFTKFEFDED